MEQMYHGDKASGTASHKDMLVKGEGTCYFVVFTYVIDNALTTSYCCYVIPGIYSHLYDTVPADIITNPNEQRRSSHQKVLKQIFLLDTKKPNIVAGTHITVAVLEKKNFTGVDFVTGRALFDTAKSTTRNLKKLMSLTLPKLNKSGTPSESGHSHDDIYKQVLDEMFVLLKGRETVDDMDGDDDCSEKEDEEEEPTKKGKRPVNWTPQGWMAYLLFGPTAPASQRLNLTTLGDPPVADGESKKKYGREQNRKNQARQKLVQREHGGKERGQPRMSVGERISLARVLISKEQQVQEKKDRKLILRNSQLSALNQKIQRALQCATATSSSEDWARYRILEDEETVLRKSMESSLDSPISVEEIICDGSSTKRSSMNSSKNSSKGSRTMSAVNNILNSFPTAGMDSSPPSSPARKKLKNTEKPLAPPAAIYVDSAEEEHPPYSGGPNLSEAGKSLLRLSRAPRVSIASTADNKSAHKQPASSSPCSSDDELSTAAENKNPQKTNLDDDQNPPLDSPASYDMRKLSLGGEAIIMVFLPLRFSGAVVSGLTKSKATCAAAYANRSMSLAYLEEEFDCLVQEDRLVTGHSGAHDAQTEYSLSALRILEEEDDDDDL
jgi:hypothetical protein